MDVRIPKLGEGAESGVVVSILVKEGDTVQKDQTILELENEKAVAPIPSTHAGVVTKIYMKAGDKVSVGQAILAIKESAGAGVVEARPIPAPNVILSEAKNLDSRVHPQDSSALSRLRMTSGSVASVPGIPQAASPSVRKMAEELGIDLSHVQGSERGGRIVVSDLRAYIQGLQAIAAGGAVSSAVSVGVAAPAKATEKIDFSKWGAIERKPVSSLRKKIGEKMTESWTTIPHVTQFDEADITALMELRKKYAPAYEKKGAKLTVTHFVMKVVVDTLKKYPAFNASLDETTNELVFKKYFHLGVAVDTEQGLIVPVVRDADKKSILELAKDLDTLAEKTRQRKVAIDDLKGGTFTISNLGSIGGQHFTPIINKPEAAILGVSRGMLKPVVIKTKTKEVVEARLMMPLALSYDHRVVDGADGARFMRALVEGLQNFDEKDAKIV